MKIIIEILIMCSFGLGGYLYKKRLKMDLEMLKVVDDFQNFYNSNMTLFKTDLQEVINKFIIMQKNKNAYFTNLFQKNTNIYVFNKDFLKQNVVNESNFDVIVNYLETMGKNDYDFEKEKNKNFEQYLKQEIAKSENNSREKGGLVFKLLLAIGAVIGIVVW